MFFIMILITIDDLDMVIQPSHLLTGFGIRRVLGIGNGFLIQSRQWQKELVVCLEVAVVERCLVFDCPVIGNDRRVIRYEDEPYLALFNDRKSQGILKSLFKGGTICNRMKVHLIGEGNITIYFGYITLWVSHLKTLDRRVWSSVG